MNKRRILHGLSILLLALAAAGVFIPGINWGLPSPAENVFLFGDRTPWSGQEILELSPVADDPDRASDVDENPLDRGRMNLLNATDEQRAEIVRRYRLFTYQPDEMQTLMALAAMKPRKGELDPKMYKYGGLWIYPVGALLKLASILNLVELKPDLAFYLDNPKAFARFYIVARAYTVLWAIIGVWAVWWIALRFAPSPPGGEGGGEGKTIHTAIGGTSPTDTVALTPHPNPLPQGERGVALAAGLCFIFMPVVVNMAHEAKPHLPGTVLVLLTAITGIKYLDTSRRRWLWITGALCGAAAGMVLSAWVAFLVLPVIAVLRREIRSTSVAALIGVAVYFATNPYVAINLLTNRALLASNFGNTAAFYHIAADSVPTAAGLVRAGMSSVLAIAGFIAAAGLAIACIQNKRFAAQMRTSLLIAAPALASGVQYALFAADQPPDYARFALLLDVALMMAAVVAAGYFIKPRFLRGLVLLVLVVSTAASGATLLAGFVRDAQGVTSRLRAAGELQNFKLLGARRLVVFVEPAPYSLPAVDVFHWQIVLMPRDAAPDLIHSGDVIVHVDDSADWAGRSIGWADKNFIIQPTRRFRGLDIPVPAGTMPAEEK